MFRKMNIEDTKKNKTNTNNKNPMEIQYKDKDKYVEKLSNVDAEVLANALRTMLSKKK